MQEKVFPNEANVVFIGLAIAGAGAVWHSAKLGVTGMVGLDKGILPQTGGTTSHTSGIQREMGGSKLNTAMRTGTRIDMEGLLSYGQPCFQKTGLLDLVSDFGSPSDNARRLADLLRKYDIAQSWGMPVVEFVTPEQVKQMLPIINAERLIAGIHIPNSGLVDANLAVDIMLREIRESGAASLWEETNVTGIDIEGDKVRGVHTNRGYIETENVVICAGIWSHQIAKMAGITLPMWPVEHANIHFGPLSELEGAEYRGRSFTGKDEGLGIYYRIQGLTHEAGDYTPRNSRRLYDPGRCSDPSYYPLFNEFPVGEYRAGFSPAERKFSMEEQAKYFEYPETHTRELFPYIGDAPILNETNGLIAVTTDESAIIGEWPILKGLWFNPRLWVAESLGGGKIFAEKFVGRACEWGDTSEVDPARFFEHDLDEERTKKLVREWAGCTYRIMHPDTQFRAGRGLFKSPIYKLEKDKFNAMHWAAAGWERVAWHKCNNALRGEHPSIVDRPEGSWEAQYWDPAIGIESLHARKHVAMCNLSSFSKFLVAGPGAPSFMEYVAVSRMPTRVDRAVYTALLDKYGGIKSDLTVQRTGAEEYLVITGAAVGMQDLRWLERHLPDDGSVTIKNVTHDYGIYGLWGPQARAVLEQVTGDDVSNTGFAYMDTREIMIHGVRVRAVRVSFVGESGWELYIKGAKNSLKVYEVLLEAGENHRIIPLGLNSYRGSMRLEKSFPLLAPQSDINLDHNLIGAGVVRDRFRYGDEFSRVKNADFIGKRALLAKRDQETPPEELICTLMMRNPERVVAAGPYPVIDPRRDKVIKYTVDGNPRCSYTTSSDNAYSLSESAGENIILARAYLPEDYAQIGTELEISYFQNRIPATVVVVGTTPLHDPDNTFMKI